MDDEKSPDSGGNEQVKNSEPVAISTIDDAEEGGAIERAAATTECKTGPQQPQRVELPLAVSAIMDIEGEVEEEENPDDRRETNGNEVGDGPLRLSTSTTRVIEGSQDPDRTHISWATERATAAAEKKAGLLKFQIDLRQKLTPRVWTSAGALDIWFSGRNKRAPCRKLAALYGPSFYRIEMLALLNDMIIVDRYLWG